jgi:drug/metabolite transporter (DMT)-like permease
MKSSILPLLLVIAGGVLYHISQKSIQRTASPLGVVIYAYAAGIVLCLVAGLLDPGERAGWLAPRQIDWAVIGIGVGAVLVEVGFLLTYRSGWDLGITSVLCSVAIALLLLPVGIIFFREHLTARMVLGIGFCLLGLVLLSRK